jgi:hypothetical protein
MRPETYDDKPKNRSPLRVIVNGWGCFLAVIMLSLGVLIGLLATIYAAPTLFNIDATETVIAEREAFLAATDIELDQREDTLDNRATRASIAQQSTRTALDNAAFLIGQTATQAQRQQNATGTATVAQGNQRRTQIALDFTATQAAFDQQATRITLDHQNTQAAIDASNSDAGIDAQSVAVTPTAIVTRTQSTTPTRTRIPTGVLLPPSDTPSPVTTSIDRRFGRWQGTAAQLRFYADADWQTSTDPTGIRATRAGAWLLLESDAITQMDVTIAPAVVIDSEYYVLFGIDTTGGYALQITAEGLSARTVTLYRVTNTTDLAYRLTTAQLERLDQAEIDQLLSSETHIAWAVDNGILSVLLNDSVILQTDVADRLYTGQIGVQLPQGAVLQRLTARQ